MVSSTLTAPPSKDALMMDRVDELQVAHALREVACRETRPPPSPASQSTTLDSYAGLESLVQQAQAKQSFAAQSSPKADGQTTMLVPSAPSEESKLEEMQASSPSNGLEALAALAVERKADHVFEPYVASSGVVSSVPSSSDEESDALAPPPPRRQRSVSNPEGMEKWDSLNRNRGGPSRRHFVLPESILEEELKEAQNAILEREKLTAEQMHRESDEENDEEASEGEEEEEENQDEEEEEEEEVDESMLTPEELLRKARSRLLEDLSEGTINGEKGELMLPHTLRKYKNVSWKGQCCFDENRLAKLTAHIHAFSLLAVDFGRCTTKTVASGFTPLPSEPLLLRVLMRNDSAVCGIRKSGTIVARV